MSDALNKLNRISRFASVIAKIVMVITVIAIIAMTAVLVITAVHSGLLVNPDLWSAAEEAPMTIGQIQAAALTGIVTATVILVIMYYIDRIFTETHKNNTPFLNENVRFLKIIAILVFVAAFVPVINATATYFLENGTGIVVGFNPLILLLMAFVIYGISIVFSYGVTLQKESDETL
jgi:hypothetical protein